MRHRLCVTGIHEAGWFKDKTWTNKSFSDFFMSMFYEKKSPFFFNLPFLLCGISLKLGHLDIRSTIWDSSYLKDDNLRRPTSLLSDASTNNNGFRIVNKMLWYQTKYLLDKYVDWELLMAKSQLKEVFNLNDQGPGHQSNMQSCMAIRFYAKTPDCLNI